MIDAQPADIDILCGDFNDDGDAPSLAFLDGSVALHGYRNQAPWRDLALEWHAARGEAPPGHPRLRAQPALETEADRRPVEALRPDLPARRSPEHEPRTLAVGLFGRRPTKIAGIVPSDHYGLYVDLTLAGL